MGASIPKTSVEPVLGLVPQKGSERYLLETYPQIIYCESSPSVEGSWKECDPYLEAGGFRHVLIPL